MPYLLASFVWLWCFVSFAQTDAQYAIHEVKKGETLYSISRQYGLRIPDLTEANRDIKGNSIRVGQKLRVPRKGESGEQVVEEMIQETEAPEVETSDSTQSVKGLPATSSRPDKHKVVRGETFSAISRRYGMSMSELSTYNPGIDPPKIIAGQILKLSSSDSPAPPVRVITATSKGNIQNHSRTIYLAPILKEIEAIHVPRKRWKNIVIHHSATTEGNARYFDHYHRNVKKWENGLAYHFVIGNGVDSGDGQIEIGPRWKRQLQGGHVRGDELNEVSIGICFVGNFQKKPPSRAQFIAAMELIRYLNSRCGQPFPIIWKHSEINPGRTVCPGRFFPSKELLNVIKAAPQ